MPDFDYGPPAPPDFALGATLGSIGIVYLGGIPLPVARELVASGEFEVVGQPLPPFASTDTEDPYNVDVTPHVPPETDTDVSGMEGAGPPTGITEPGPPPPPDEGGPEDRGPPTEFDTPPPTLPPPSVAPSVNPLGPGPVEGEYIPRSDTPRAPPPPRPDIPGEYEVFGPRSSRRIPGTPPIPRGKRVRPIKNIPDRSTPPPAARRAQRPLGAPRGPEVPPPLPPPVDPQSVAGAILRRLGRVVLGPAGGIPGQIIEAGLPEILGSGELPFPPIPQVTIPPPEPDLQYPSLPDVEPPEPELLGPPAPDVITVTPEDETPWPRNVTSVPPFSSPSAPTTATTPRAPGLGPLLGAIIGAIIGRVIGPSPTPSSLSSPIPRDLEVPPRPVEPVAPPLPLTPVEPVVVPSPEPLPAGPLTPLATSTATSEEQRCRCPKCRKPRRKKPHPSNKIAHLKPYARRMSVESLKNLKRGKRRP